MSHGQGRVRHEIEIYVLMYSTSGIGPVRRVKGALTAWEDGRWRATLAFGQDGPVTVDGDDGDSIAATVERLVAATVA